MQHDGVALPQQGFWFAPASAGSRQNFRSAQVMLDVSGECGATIWQSGEQQ
jgi:hypothetical protein